MTRPPALVVTDDAQHGVTVYARQLADAVARQHDDVEVVGPGALTGDAPPARAHLHFTDRLWAGSPEDAAARLEELARRVELTVTLHDLPQPSDGVVNLPRRAECYRRVAAASTGVVVNSRHEAALLTEHVRVDPARPVGVVPLPVDPVDPDPARPADDGSAAVIGFFYPGKGHAELVDAVAGLRPRGVDLGVAVLGRASAGHEGELADLAAEAARRGVDLEVTGYLDDAALLDRSRRAAVPVAAHRHVSASGSIATWVAAGRRPLVPDTRYSREMAELRPGTLTLFAEGGLADAVARAQRDPGSTWWAAGTDVGPGLVDTAAAYLAWWAAVEASS